MLTHFLDLLAAVISVTSLLIVTYGALIGIISFLKNEIRRFTGGYSITNIRKLRATFGTYLLLGLEFLIASDILKTVLEPTLNELALLGGIVVLRTILSVFLNKEIKELESEFDRLLIFAVNENDIVDQKLKQVSESILHLKQKKKQIEYSTEHSKVLEAKSKEVMALISAEDLNLTEYSDTLVYRIVEKVTVLSSEEIKIRFIGGFEITQPLY